MNTQYTRLLRGYSLDPGFSTRLDTVGINEIVYRIRWEDKLKPGPCGEYFEVIDYDPASACFYEPVRLTSIEVLRTNGLSPSEGNPQFHQQFVYTIAMQTLAHFEESLGRKIIWTPRDTGKQGENAKPSENKEYVDKIRIYPHAFRDPNAFYVPEKKAVLFGYFEAASKEHSENIPRGVIFTCLSPDIIAHEMTHAILDSIHPQFLENTNPDVTAFHEGFADIVALLLRFTNTPLVEHQIAKTRGDLGQFSFLGELATQFGNALSFNRGALRGAIGRLNDKGVWEKLKPNPRDYQTKFEPHERGAILVAAIFDAFLRLYNNTTEDLIRIASNGTGILQPGAIHPDLVKRLANTACSIAEHLLHVCIRALDYCPPNDINYGDFLRAMITADLDSSPKDDAGYRIALIEAFRSWGIFPDRVNTLSIESLQWAKPTNQLDGAEKEILRKTGKTLRDYVRKIIDTSSDSGKNREDIYHASMEAMDYLHGMILNREELGVEPDVWTKFLGDLGLTDKVVTLIYKDETGKETPYSSGSVPPLVVHKLRPVYRVGREGTLLEQVVITLSQSFRIEEGKLKGATFGGGCTLILNMSNQYDVEYIIYKSIKSGNRFQKQMDFQLGKSTGSVSLTDSMYEHENTFEPVNFAHLHFHNVI